MMILPMLADSTAQAAPTGPVLPASAVWAGVLLVIVAALFLAAAVIGPIVRAVNPPPLDGQDEHGHPHVS